MSAQDQLTLDVIVKVSTGSISRLDGQKILDVSERTIRRYLSEYKNQGVMFIRHGNCGRSPTNATSSELRVKIQTLVKENYFDFNMTHCLEKLSANEGLHLKRETFRKWCHKINLVKKTKRRGAKVRKLRQRMKQTGLMIQMDGSPHRWFGNRESCLIAGIDDADSNVPWGEFFPAEDSVSCMVVLQKIVEKMGIFKILYVDRAGIYGGPKRAEFSQVKRALAELGIHVVFANSAEGKGRIERLWGTFQDRLIPEMRIRNITTYAGANSFLQDVYLPGEYAQKFKVIPECLQTAYQPVPSDVDLKEIFCLKYHRSVNKDHTYSYEGDTYLIESELKHSIQNQKIEIRIYQNLKSKVFFAGRELEVSKVEHRKKVGEMQAKIDEKIESASQTELNPGTRQKVRLDGHVMTNARYYSVDEKWIGTELNVVIKGQEIKIFHEGSLIETHQKLNTPHIKNSTKTRHMGPWRRALSEMSIYQKAAKKYGPQVQTFIKLSLERGNGYIDTTTIWGVLSFQKEYGSLMLNEACEWAIGIEAPTYRAVKSYLNLMAKRPPKRTIIQSK